MAGRHHRAAWPCQAGRPPHTPSMVQGYPTAREFCRLSRSVNTPLGSAG